MPECIEYAKDESPYLVWDDADVCSASFAYSTAFSEVNDLDDWYFRGIDVQLADVRPLRNIGDEFPSLVKKWKEDTWHLASASKRTTHPAYLQIIGMGADALPYIFNELRNSPDYWHCALYSITRREPYSPGASLQEMTQAWLNWAREHGY